LSQKAASPFGIALRLGANRILLLEAANEWKRAADLLELQL
jgi:hypothetical protein